MKKQQTDRSGVRINAEKLRYYRDQKNLTQRALAEKAHYCEDYISQLERANSTRNKGRKWETLWRLAKVLGVPYENLILSDPAVTVRTALPQQTFFELYTGGNDILLDPEQLQKVRHENKLTQRELAEKAHYSEDYISRLERAPHNPKKGNTAETIWTLARALAVSPEALLISSQHMLVMPLPPPEMNPLVREFTINSRGQWFEEEKDQLISRTKYNRGGEEWAKITLYCAWMRQQAGDVKGASAYIQEVEQHSLNETDQPNPGIIARVHNQRGWIEDEQYGNFEHALRKFDMALREALAANDRNTERTARYFRFRILSEQGMTESGAWLGARPTRALSNNRIKQLCQSLDSDMPIVHRLEPENPHADYREFLVHALMQAWNARQTIPTLRDRAKDTDTERFMTLNCARWVLSSGEYGRASGLAAEAFEGFTQAAFPQGIAHSSAVQARALYQNGLTTKIDCSLCLDLWLLTLLLHPYKSHPLWQIAFNGLGKTIQHVAKLSQFWIHSYFDEIDERVKNKEEKFQALKHVYLESDVVTPTGIFDHFIIPKNSC